MSKKFSVSEISRQLGVNPRQVQRMLKNLISIEKGYYRVDESILELLQSHDNDTSISGQVATTDDMVIEGFTKEEYQEFKKRLIEYPLLKSHIQTILQELDYHKRSSESKNRQLELVLQNIRERNFIEATDKKQRI
ncbi:MAG: hypothetical protein COB81_05675 [Flavobacteriaceae bacterium]|nr:MAG: hypothetical protein COB81_05675 [Flavobacteriaceae bacterium]